MQYEEILKIAHEISKLGMSRFEYSEDSLHIAMEFPQGAAAVKEKASPALVETKEEAPKVQEPAGIPVKSPLVGTFYAAPSEDAEPFVKVGDRVHKGQTLGIVEAMKLMNEIECECEGVVEAILAVNRDAVEYGQELFRITPAA